MPEFVITEQVKVLIRQIAREEVEKVLTEEKKTALRKAFKPGPQEHK